MKVQSLKSYLLARLRQCIRRARDEMVPRLRQCIGRARDEMALLPRLRQRIWRARDEIALLPRLPQSAIRLQTYSKLYKVSPLVFLPFKSLLFKLFFCFFFLSLVHGRYLREIARQVRALRMEQKRQRVRADAGDVHPVFTAEYEMPLKTASAFFDFEAKLVANSDVRQNLVSILCFLFTRSRFLSLFCLFLLFLFLLFLHLEEKRWRMQQNFVGKNASQIPSLRKGPGQEQLAVLKRTETLSLVVPN